jgi:hypothetical protein
MLIVGSKVRPTSIAKNAHVKVIRLRGKKFVKGWVIVEDRGG